MNISKQYLFQLRNKETNGIENIYSVDRKDKKTEFLCYDDGSGIYKSGFYWVDSNYFEPLIIK